jgi:hypothetical protein
MHPSSPSFFFYTPIPFCTLHFLYNLFCWCFISLIFLQLLIFHWMYSIIYRTYFPLMVQ